MDENPSFSHAVGKEIEVGLAFGVRKAGGETLQKAVQALDMLMRPSSWRWVLALQTFTSLWLCTSLLGSLVGILLLLTPKGQTLFHTSLLPGGWWWNGAESSLATHPPRPVKRWTSVSECDFGSHAVSLIHSLFLFPSLQASFCKGSPQPSGGSTGEGFAGGKMGLLVFPLLLLSSSPVPFSYSMFSVSPLPHKLFPLCVYLFTCSASYILLAPGPVLLPCHPFEWPDRTQL